MLFLVAFFQALGGKKCWPPGKCHEGVNGKFHPITMQPQGNGFLLLAFFQAPSPKPGVIGFQPCPESLQPVQAKQGWSQLWVTFKKQPHQYMWQDHMAWGHCFVIFFFGVKGWHLYGEGGAFFQASILGFFLIGFQQPEKISVAIVRIGAKCP